MTDYLRNKRIETIGNWLSSVFVKRWHQRGIYRKNYLIVLNVEWAVRWHIFHKWLWPIMNNFLTWCHHILTI